MADTDKNRAKEEKTDDADVCKTTLDMIERTAEAGIRTTFARRQTTKPCTFGAEGLCCRHCSMGPCRITTKTPTGVCGATGATIAARNFARMVAAGTAAHSDHGREITHTFIEAARGEAPDYQIKDETKLIALADDLGIKVDNRPVNEIAEEVGKLCLAQFDQVDEGIVFTKKAPKKRQEIWKSLGIIPRGIDREIVDTLHRTSVGVDQDYRNIITQSLRTSLADGWGGSMIATELTDIMFGTPVPVRSQVNLGVLKEDQVNILVHGHNPLVSEMIVSVAQDPEMIKKAQAKGAKGINIAGICCTANEILMRHGIPIAGNFVQQELALATGAVEAMAVDVQCVMSSLPEVAKCFHTKLITTSPQAKIAGAVHIEFEPHKAREVASKIVETAIENYPNRKDCFIPEKPVDLVAGFSHETINYMLGGSFRASYHPLNDNIINGRIRGLCGVVGCGRPGGNPESVHRALVRELIANDVLVIQSGCAAISCAKDGLLVPEAAKYAGPGLAEVCETVGIPPVLHTGSCVDNSRILIEATNVIKEGGLGDDFPDVPAVGACPEWMSEKAIAIGQYFVASGVYTIFGLPFPVTGSEDVYNFLTGEIEELTGGRWGVAEPDPIKIAGMAIDHIDKARKALGIDKKPARVLYDMAMRRELKF
jgi:carbon-monoxide dehydrogenase catalytic subunit